MVDLTTLQAQTSCGVGESSFSKPGRCQLPSNNETCQLVDPKWVMVRLYVCTRGIALCFGLQSSRFLCACRMLDA